MRVCARVDVSMRACGSCTSAPRGSTAGECSTVNIDGRMQRNELNDMRSIAKVNNSLACLFAVIYIVGGNRDWVFAWYLKGARGWSGFNTWVHASRRINFIFLLQSLRDTVCATHSSNTSVVLSSVFLLTTHFPRIFCNIRG